jgi:transposase-like protein
MRLGKQVVLSKGKTYYYKRYVCDACKYKRDKENNVNLRRKRKRYDSSKELIKMAIDNIKQFLQNETDESARIHLAWSGIELNKIRLRL